jgi:hypothetical protein
MPIAAVIFTEPTNHPPDLASNKLDVLLFILHYCPKRKTAGALSV